MGSMDDPEGTAWRIDPMSLSAPHLAEPVVVEAVPTERIEGLSERPYPSPPPGFAIKAVRAVRRLFRRLSNALVPPEVVLFEMSTGVVFTHLLGAVARLGIADLLEAGPLTAEELSVRTGSDADALHRALRGLVFSGVFRLRADGRFENDRYSRALRSGQLARGREWAQYFSTRSNVDAWAAVDTTLRTGKSGFVAAHGCSVWDWFECHPEEQEFFAQSMMGLTVADAPVVARQYPFHEVRRLCDVGGGRGALLSELLVRHAKLEAVLCDAPGVLASAQVLLTRRGVADRVQLVPGSFFESVPGGCDAYLLKNVLHDWDDARCARILLNVRRAMSPGGRLLLVESLLERTEWNNVAALGDLQMMVVCDEGRERGRGEFARLMTAAGFRPARVFATPTVSIIEGIAAR